MTRTPNPHDEHLRTGWRLCRFGAEAVDAVAAFARVEGWLDRMGAVVPGSPHLEEWRRLLIDRGDDAWAELRSVADFFELTPARQAYWRPLVQSQPFSCLLPGRTTRERRTVLSRLP